MAIAMGNGGGEAFLPSPLRERGERSGKSRQKRTGLDLPCALEGGSLSAATDGLHTHEHPGSFKREQKDPPSRRSPCYS